jgi:LysR family hca operon transcriptional activator
VTRPLQGDAPTIELVIGYSRANTSALLKRFLARTDELLSRTMERRAQTAGHAGRRN